MPTRNRPLLAVTAGDPAGVGPDVVCQLQDSKLSADIVIVGSRDALDERARMLGKNFATADYDPGKKQKVSLVDIPLAAGVEPGMASEKNTKAILESIDRAAQLAASGELDGMVTAPVAKATLARQFDGFVGQTEHLARLAGAKLPVMAMVNDALRIALATTHLPIAHVPSALTEKLIVEVLCVADKDARKRFRLDKPHWKVLGLNPHAGEEGLFGNEEIEVIKPAIAKARKMGIDATGPHSADTAFLHKNVSADDFFLAMYHDQALPVIKRDDFANTVNVTLGLPFVRTSVDHGTAYDLAGTGEADPMPMVAAVELASRLVN